jgi:carboxyl-terminal processing protease
MRRNRIRLLITFLAGVVAAGAAGGLAGSVGSIAATRYDDLSLFTSVLTHVRRHYVEPVEEKTLLRGAVNGMLHELDPHSSYLDEDAYKEAQGRLHRGGVAHRGNAGGPRRHPRARSDRHDLPDRAARELE